jgi:hypothetical protein
MDLAFRIEPATERDVGVVLGMIKTLAARRAMDLNQERPIGR